MRDPSGSQPRSGPSWNGRLMPSFTRAMTCPPACRIAVIRSWPGKFRSKQDDAAGEQVRAALHEALQQGLLPGRRPGRGSRRASRGRRGRSARRPAAAGTARNRPRSRSCRRTPGSPGCPPGSPASRRRRRTGMPGQHDRGRLVVADERPGRLPEEVLHHVRRDQQPPVRDHLPRRDVPFQGERDVREQPGQPGAAPRSTRRPASASSRSSAG